MILDAEFYDPNSESDLSDTTHDGDSDTDTESDEVDTESDGSSIYVNSESNDTESDDSKSSNYTPFDDSDRDTESEQDYDTASDCTPDTERSDHDSDTERSDHDTENDDVAYVDSTLLCPLSRYILAKDTNAVKRILRKRKKNPTQLREDDRGWTALHVAAFNDEHSDCLKLLLKNNDTVQLNIDARTHNKKTALHLACYKGCLKNCRILLESQCNPDIPDIYGFTPLHVASMYGHADIVSQLIAHGLNVNCYNIFDYDNTALHYASGEGNLEVVRALMRSKQIKVNTRNANGQSPLHVACKNGSLEILKILLEVDHCLLNKCDFNAVTPLVVAIQYHNFEYVKYLLEQGATANCCSWNRTALSAATKTGNTKILSLVLRKTSSVYIREQFMLRVQDTLSDCDRIFRSLMCRVINSRSPECMSLLLESAIPKGILEAPRFFHEDDFLIMNSPLAFLFAAVKWSSSEPDKFEEMLRLLLKYNITHLHEFTGMVDWKADHILAIRYVHPLTNIFSEPFSDKQRDRYLNTLFDNGITTDYCLQCDVHYDGSFLDFDVNVLKRFYEPVVWAVEEDKAELIELLLVNSAILEPSHVWNFLQCQKSVMLERVQNVVNYLNDLGVIVNTSNVPLYSIGGTIKNPNLQQLCRQAIRKHLRDVTMKDNLKNFKAKINALPLPDSLIDYLHFKST